MKPLKGDDIYINIPALFLVPQEKVDPLLIKFKKRNKDFRIIDSIGRSVSFNKVI